MLRQEYFTGPAGHRLSSLHLAGEAPGLLLVGGYGRLSPVSKPFGQLAVSYCRARKLDLRILEFRGQGQSEGELLQLTLSDMRDDLLALAGQFELAGRIGIGASLGAWAMLAAQQKQPALLWGMLALAPALDWDQTYFAPRLADGRARRDGGTVAVPEDNIAVSERFLASAEDARLDLAGGLSLPGALRILHGSDDVIAPLSRSDDLARHGGAITLRVFPGLGHEVSTLASRPLQQSFVEECDLLLQAWRRQAAADPA